MTSAGVVLPELLGADDRRWVNGLMERGVTHERICRDLHAILLRAARFEVAQRGGAYRVSGADVEDIACQAASDALLLIIRKAGDFRGDSAFTTWATRFVQFEVRAKLRQYTSRHRTVEIGPEHGEQLAQTNADPCVQVEARELAEAVRGVVNDRLTANQREVFAALLGHDLSAADLALRMGVNANAIYQIAFRARHCLRGQLRAGGFLD